MENAVLLHTLNEQAKTLFTFAQGALRTPLVRDVLKDNAKKVMRKRKDLHGVNALADALVPVSDFPQIPRLLRADRFQTRFRKRCFQELGKISQSLAAKVLEGCTRKCCGRWIDVNDLERPGVFQILQMQNEHPHGHASEDFGRERSSDLRRFLDGGFCGVGSRPRTSARRHKLFFGYRLLSMPREATGKSPERKCVNPAFSPQVFLAMR